MSAEPVFRDTVYVRFGARLRWRDRLRILWHGRVDARVEVDTEHEVGLAESRSTIQIPTIIPPRRTTGEGFSPILDGPDGCVDTGAP